jgi:predicted RNA-binding Zn-ribbon protein involved in translation (DUF1610 family)
VRSSSCLAEFPTIAAAAKCRHPRKCIARRIALANGLHYVYAGNVHDRKGGSTYCPQCGTRVIERDWYELGAWQLTDTDACKNCGTQIPGVFAGQPGAWGARRLGVRLAAHAAPADNFAANGVAAACVGLGQQHRNA